MTQSIALFMPAPAPMPVGTAMPPPHPLRGSRHGNPAPKNAARRKAFRPHTSLDFGILFLCDAGLKKILFWKPLGALLFFGTLFLPWGIL